MILGICVTSSSFPQLAQTLLLGGRGVGASGGFLTKPLCDSVVQRQQESERRESAEGHAALLSQSNTAGDRESEHTYRPQLCRSPNAYSGEEASKDFALDMRMTKKMCFV